MHLLTTIKQALADRDTRLVKRADIIARAMADANSNMMPSRDSLGRFHAPCTGYIVDDMEYRKGEFIRDSLDMIEAKEEAGIVPTTRKPFTVRHLISVDNQQAIIDACQHDAIVSVSFGKAFDGHRYAYIKTHVKAIVSAVEASESNRKKGSYAEKSGTAPVGRVSVEAVVLSVKIVDNGFNMVEKMLVKFDDGSTAYGSVPAKLSGVKAGENVAFTATFKQADNDTTHAFFSRPAKASFVEPETSEPYIQGIICNDIVEEIPSQQEYASVNDTIQRLLDLRAKCTTDELTSLNRIISELDGQLNMGMAAYSYHANNIAHLLCAEDRFALVPSHVEHHSALCDNTGDFDDIGMEAYADCYHSAQKAKYGLL